MDAAAGATRPVGLRHRGAVTALTQRKRAQAGLPINDSCFRDGDLLVLHRGNPKDSHPGNYVRVTTINAGTGLEAPIVFLMGLYQFFEKENSLRLSEDDRAELVLSNTRKIYMAATRAGQRLVVTYVRRIPTVLEACAE